MHEIFIQEVAAGRKMPIEDVRVLADGSIFTGMEAVNNGLIDEIGGQKEAIAYLEEVLELDSIDLVEYIDEVSFFELLGGYISKHGFAIGQGVSSKPLVEQSFSIKT